MSPEQATGEPVDGRSDFYSLGMILWELAVGNRPFEGRSFGEWVLLHATREPTPPSHAERRQLRGEIPAALDEAVLRCLAKRPEHRFGSALELREALAAIVAPLALAEPAPPRRHWPLAVAGGAMLIALVGLLAARHAGKAIGPSPARVSPPSTASTQSTLPMEFEPTEIAPTSAPASFPPLIVRQARPAKKRAPIMRSRQERAHDDGDLPATELKDPFAP